jgi:hypothetical protein
MAKVRARLVLLVVGVLWIAWMWQRRGVGGDGSRAGKVGRARILRPLTPMDGLLCRQREGGQGIAHQVVGGLREQRVACALFVTHICVGLA